MGTKGNITAIVDPGIDGIIKNASARGWITRNHDFGNVAVLIRHKYSLSQMGRCACRRRHNSRKDDFSVVVETGVLASRLKDAEPGR